MSDPFDDSNFQVKRLTVLSKNINDAINEIFSMAYAQAHTLNLDPTPKGDPDIRLVENSLWVNRIMLPLASRQKTLTLVQAFFRSETLTLSKAEIVSAVYGTDEHHSARYMEAQEINLTKLLSRTRSFLEEALEHMLQPSPIDWLVFDIKTRKYRLYQVRAEYLKSH